MTKRYAAFLSLLFCAFLFGVLALHLALPDRERSEVENRSLAQAPALTAASVAGGGFMDDAEEYINDQFPGRDGWTGLRARAEQLLGKTEFHGVYLCGDTLINRGTEPGSQSESSLAAVTNLAARTDAPVYLGLIPTASEIWADKLPAGAQRPDQGAFIASALERTGLPGVDFLSALRARADQPVYYRTDHHWTTLGAYYGYAALCDALGITPAAPDAFSPETVSEDFNGTLYSTSGVHWLPPDTMEVYVPEDGLTVTSWRSGRPERAELYDRAFLEKKDKYSFFLGGNQPLCVLENPAAATEQTLLLVRDSYADALAPFLAQTFAEVHLIDLRYYRLPVADYAAEQGVAAIVIAYSVENFITDREIGLLAQ